LLPESLPLETHLAAEDRKQKSKKKTLTAPGIGGRSKGIGKRRGAKRPPAVPGRR